MQEALLILLAYMLGSIPSSVWISKYFFGIDIRDYGSGNAGATNTYRTLGAKWGTIVMVMDMLKGFAAVKLSYLISHYTTNELHQTNFQLGLGMAAVLGHIFPLWADFKGGKGVATLFGMVLGIQPNVALLTVAVFLLVLYLTRYVSLSSILAAVMFPVFILAIYNEPEPWYRVFAIVVGAMVVITHQKNIQRLVKGVESRANILKYRDRRRQRRKRDDD
jgi:acyl phosphate:glycerol-3-phosphate acyltransferase